MPLFLFRHEYVENFSAAILLAFPAMNNRIIFQSPQSIVSTPNETKQKAWKRAIYWKSGRKKTRAQLNVMKYNPIVRLLSASGLSGVGDDRAQFRLHYAEGASDARNRHDKFTVLSSQTPEARLMTSKSASFCALPLRVLTTTTIVICCCSSSLRIQFK